MLIIFEMGRFLRIAGLKPTGGRSFESAVAASSEEIDAEHAANWLPF
jgi:hypothetical protein